MIEQQDSEQFPGSQQAQLIVPTDLSLLSTQVLPWFDQLYQSSISSGVWLRCKLALAEAFSNVIRYAHRDLSPSTSIKIEVTVDPQHLEIRVWDYGRPFDFNKKLQEKLTSISPEDGGGRGLKLMYDIADELSYNRIGDQQNCLLLVKFF